MVVAKAVMAQAVCDEATVTATPTRLGLRHLWQRCGHGGRHAGATRVVWAAATGGAPSDDGGDGDGDVESAIEKKQKDFSFKSLDARIWSLALPAVASLLLDPVLGAVDTAFVGRIQGEGADEALGGLAIATTVFNFSFKLFNFLAVVTGPLVATQIAAAQKAEAGAEAKDDDVDGDVAVGAKDWRGRGAGREAAADTVGGAMTLALLLGFGALVTLQLGSDEIIAWAGGDAAETAAATATAAAAAADGASSSAAAAAAAAPDATLLMSEAEAYLRVRAWSAPAALVGTVVGAVQLDPGLTAVDPALGFSA